MADVRGIYTIDRAGTATLVKNLEDGTGFFAVRDSVTITPAPRKQIMAAGQNRYEGSVQVGETHDNGTYTWQCLVAGSSIDDALTKAEALIGVGEAFAPGRYLGWSPAGATNVTYCEIRGAFTFKPGYQPQQFVQTKTWVIDVSVPVAPLVRKAALQSIVLPGVTAPMVVALGCQYNLITNPSFETDLNGWGTFYTGGLTATSFTRVAANPLSGTYSGRVQATRPADTTARWFSIYTLVKIPVFPGQQISASASINVISAWTTGVRVEFGYYQADGVTFISQTNGSYQTGTGVKTATVSDTVPALAAFVQVAISGYSSTASQVFDGYIDGISYVLGATPLSPYKDGDSAGWKWAGTAHASESYNATGTSVAGNAPALADVSLRTAGGAAAPIWALIAWWKRMTLAPLSGSVAPFGIIEAETGSSLSGWSSVFAATARGLTCLQVAAAGAGTVSATYVIDPSIAQADDFQATVAVEVWGRVFIENTIVSPRMTVSAAPNAGASFGSRRYTAEYGAAGKLLTKASAGLTWRFIRLGILTLPVDKLTPAKWSIFVDGSYAAGSTGGYILDYLVLVPANARACGRTGVANDSGYAKFVQSTSDTTKTVRSDLSGAVASGATNPAVDTGLGGSRLWLPPGDVDMLVKLSSLVPDDPTVDATTEQTGHAMTGAVSLVTRNWLVN